MMFNGTVAHTPVAVKLGDRVRIYFVNVGPDDSAVPPGGGVAFEFRPRPKAIYACGPQ
jgi:hypothetical protein